MDDHDDMQVEDIKKPLLQAPLPSQVEEDRKIPLTESKDSDTNGNGLDTMFDDDDLDNYNEEEEQQYTQAPIESAASYDVSDPEVMTAFYQRLFPWTTLFRWLNHSDEPKTDFVNREFAFTLQNKAYIRYLSFKDADGLKKETLRLNPERFEIGPVYTANPRDRKTLRKAVFKPLEKELVFDIDLTDYDEIRTCCQKTAICNKCWQFVTMAIKVMDVALRDDFSFKHILWVYSGRRGAHAWICDKKARQLDDARRRSIATYLEVIKGGSQAGKKVNVMRPLHPHLSRSLNILKEDFTANILVAQDPWRDTKQADKLLQLLPDRLLSEALRKKWDSHNNRPSSNKWSDIDSLASTGISNTLNTKTLKESKQDILIEYTYPRLDAEVSKHLNHLLKSPFCVHPGTGRVCVPINGSRPEDFDPENAPTVFQLLKEIDDWKRTNDDEKIEDWEKTSLKPYIDAFSVFVNGLIDEEEGKGSKKVKDEMEF